MALWPRSDGSSPRSVDRLRQRARTRRRETVAALAVFGVVMIAACDGLVSTPKETDAAADRNVRIIDVGHKGNVVTVALSPDGKTLATASFDETVRLWDIAARRTIHSFPCGIDGTPLAFSPDGRLLATVGENSAVLVWDVASGHIAATLTGHTRHIESVAFSPRRQIGRHGQRRRDCPRVEPCYRADQYDTGGLLGCCVRRGA